MSLDKSQIIDLTKPATRDYKKFLLKHNPFPATGVPEDTPLFTVDREDIIKKFQNVIAEILQSNNSVLTVLVGENGSGKSHILRLFKYNINAQLLSRENGMLAAYVKNPGREFYDLYKTMVDDIGKSHFAEIIGEFVGEQLKSNSNFKQYFVKKIFYDQFVNGTLSLDAVLSECVYLDLQKEIYRLKFQNIGNSDVVYALLSLVNPNFSSYAWQWLLAEKMDKSEKDSIGVGSSITEDNAYSIFADIIKALSVMGIKYFIYVSSIVINN
jgi:Cdc6-like AAA superfamily ATPase